MKDQRCQLEAHKGVASEAPENTMAAFRLAVEQKYDMIELDPAFTADHVCVIHHDRTIGRCECYAGGAGIPEEERKRVDQLSFAELRALDAGSWFEPRFAGEKIPSLAEVLDFAKTNRIPLKIDNKIESFSPQDFRIFCDQIHAEEMEDLIGITGFHPDFLARITAEFPAAAIHYDGFVTGEALKQLNSIRKENPLYIWMRFDNRQTAWNKTVPVARESSALAHEFGKVGVWILTEAEEARTAIREFQPDIIETTGLLKPAMLAEITR